MEGDGKAAQRREEEETFLAFLEERGAEIHDKALAGRNRSVTTTAAKDHLFKQQIEDVLDLCLERKYFCKEYKPRKKKATERVLNLMLSDLHFGAALDPREVPVQYGHVEEARRLAAVVRMVADWKLQYRDETELRVHLLGDIIQNQLHDPRDGAPLAEQAAAAMHLLTQAVVFLASQFKKVTMDCTPGNHGRNVARHKDRATNQKWDSIENIIYYGVKTATSHLKNVTVNIPYTPYYTYEVFGMTGFMTHGDTVLKPGFPSSTIDIAGIRKQINEINAKLGPDKKHVLFGCGHVHCHSCTKLPNQVTFITNSCLIPTDAYAQSIGIIDTSCSQTVWESVPGRMVGHRCEADVDEHTDKDKSLDALIKPFERF